MRVVAISICAAMLFGCAALPEGSTEPARKDHYVKLKSSAPGMKGAETSIYVREIPAAPSSSIPKADRVVLFVHGGSTPGSEVFDLPRPSYSWMRYFSNAGYDTFALDFTGYGRSTRPPPMSDPCNLPEDQQKLLIPAIIPAPCKPSISEPIATMQSEWDELEAVIEYVRKLRGVAKVSIVAWSRGGPRTSGYLLRHPDRVSRMFLLAPDYARNWSMDKPTLTPTPMIAPMNRGRDAPPPAGCEGYYDPAIRDLARKESVALDPVGTQWGGAFRQLPSLKYGMNPEGAKRIRVPIAMAAGALDTVVLPARVKEFYEDLGSADKIFIDLGCASHSAMWEKHRGLLFKASLDWIRDGKIEGKNRGELKMGY
jgi:pimeloyl-ACP methyl ester carboxylesterase